MVEGEWGELKFPIIIAGIAAFYINIKEVPDKRLVPFKFRREQTSTVMVRP